MKIGSHVTPLLRSQKKFFSLFKATTTTPPLMTAYFDVRFKFPWSTHGYTHEDRVAFHRLTGYKHFIVGVNPDRTFNYLRIYDEGGRVKIDTELSNICYAGLEALLLWRMSTPLPVLKSMAMVCLGLREDRASSMEPPKSVRLDVEDDRFLVDLSKVPLQDFHDHKTCVMLVERRAERLYQGEPLARELLLYGQR